MATIPTEGTKNEEKSENPGIVALRNLQLNDDQKSPEPATHLTATAPDSDTAAHKEPEEDEEEKFEDVDEGAKFEDLDLSATGPDNGHHEESLVTPRPKSQTPPLLTDLRTSDNIVEVKSPSSPQALDALLSPTRTEHSARESVAASDVTDDDARFSTVMLSSARQSLADVPELPEANEGPSSPTHTLAETATLYDERRETLDGSELIRLVHTNRVHKKTASNSTIVSGILSRAEVDGDESERRASLDGKLRLQEEFGKRQDYELAGEADWSAYSAHLFFLISKLRT